MLFLTQSESSQPTPDGSRIIGTFSRPDDFEGLSPANDPFSKYSEDPPALIAVLGATGSGKTAFVNLASTSHLRVGDNLLSCTCEIQESAEFILDGRRVILIDTPGFDNTYVSDMEVLKSIAAFLGESYFAGAKLAGVIYVHRISDIRFGGAAVKNFRMFREFCGEKTLKNVILMTNMWGKVTPQEGAAREQQLREEHFKAAIDKGARMQRHNNTPESARAILREILKNKPVVLKIQRELIDEGKNIGETGAGAELNREIHEFVEKHRREVRELEECLRRAMEEKDEEYRQELEEDRRKMKEKVEKLQKNSKMQSEFELARREMEERINTRVKAQMLRIREAYEVEIRKREADIQKYEAEIRTCEEKVRELERDGDKNASQIIASLKMMVDLHQKVATNVKTIEDLRNKLAANSKRSCTTM